MTKNNETSKRKKCPIYVVNKYSHFFNLQRWTFKFIIYAAEQLHENKK
jgi:hypothetical protein